MKEQGRPILNRILANKFKNIRKHVPRGRAWRPPYAAMIDHVLACLTSRAENRIEPASALPALELTLDVHHRLTQPAS
jgi:hypothetical protein